MALYSEAALNSAAAAAAGDSVCLSAPRVAQTAGTGEDAEVPGLCALPCVQAMAAQPTLTRLCTAGLFYALNNGGCAGGFGWWTPPLSELSRANRVVHWHVRGSCARRQSN